MVVVAVLLGGVFVFFLIAEIPSASVKGTVRKFTNNNKPSQECHVTILYNRSVFAFGGGSEPPNGASPQTPFTC